MRKWIVLLIVFNIVVLILNYPVFIVLLNWQAAGIGGWLARGWYDNRRRERKRLQHLARSLRVQVETEDEGGVEHAPLPEPEEDPLPEVSGDALHQVNDVLLGVISTGRPHA